MTRKEWNQWLKEAKKRTEKDSSMWMKYDCYNPALIIKLKEIMGLKNVRLVPDDRLAYILYNPHWDMRDVEAALEIEKNLGIELLPYMTGEKAYLDLSLSDLMMLIGRKDLTESNK